MTVQEIITMISTVGFPIVACIFIYLQNGRETVAHSEEINKLKEAIDNNNIVLAKILEYLRKEEDDKR